MTSSELVKEIKRGNKLAEECLFNQLRGKYLALCLRYIKNPEDAEERMLDGFYKFFTTIDSFHYVDEHRFQFWIRRIMVNECLMQLRTKSFFNITAESEAEDMETQDDILDRLSASEILKTITQLPVGYRTIFNLFVVDGYEHGEIARMLKISKGSSKSQLSKARQLLQKILINKTAYVSQQSK